MDSLSVYEKSIFVLVFSVVISLYIRYVNLRKNQRNKIIKKMKSGEIESKEIVGKIIAVKYELQGGGYGNSNPNYINKWYFIVEGEGFITHQKKFYKSEEYDYDGPISHVFSLRLNGPSENDKELFKDYISKYIKIGDKVKIFVSKENSDNYYLEEIKELKKIKISKTFVC